MHAYRVYLQAPEKEVKAMTDERVDRLHKLLIAASQTADGRKPPKLSFFEYVVNPHSFPETIENIFDLSFLVRKGLARLLEQPHERVSEVSEAARQAGRQAVAQHAVSVACCCALHRAVSSLGFLVFRLF